MNILMMSKIFVQSGVGIHIRDLSAELIDKGHNVWIASGNNDHQDFCSEKAIPFLKIPFSLNPKTFLKNISVLKKYLKENKIDIVHCHHRTCSVYMRVLSFITGVPFIWSNHLSDIPSDFLHRVTTFYGKRVICVSSELKDFCTEKLRIPKDKISVIIHGIKPESYTVDTEYTKEFKALHGIDNQKIIGLFARMAPIKGHGCVIEAMSNMSAEALEKIRVVFFGGTEGEYVESLKKEISRNNLDKYIIFEGFIKPNQALSLSDMTILPSLYEGFGIVTIESYLMKKPHLRTKTAGYEDVKTGCIGIEVNDVKALEKELTEFAMGKDYTEMTERAYNFVLEQCTLERMTEKIIQVYKEVTTK